MTEDTLRCSVQDLMWLSKNADMGHATAVYRLQKALDIAFKSGRLDREEIDHLREIMRIFKYEVSTTPFHTMLDFKGPTA